MVVTSKTPVAVFAGTLPVAGCPSDIPTLCNLLAQHAIAYRIIDEQALQVIDTDSTCAILVLPAAASFPLLAVPALRRYLHRGGHMVTLGGYAFAHLVLQDDSSGEWHETATISDSLIANGELCSLDFSGLPSGWQRNDAQYCITEECVIDGRAIRALRMEVPQSALDQASGVGQDPSAEWSCPVDSCEPGATYVLSALMKAEGVGGRHFAHFHWTYLRVEQIDGNGQPIHNQILDFEHPYFYGDESWRLMRYRFWPEPQAVRLVVRIGIKGGAFGTVWATNIQLQREEWAYTQIGMVCDGMRVQPDQIGVFDPSFRLANVASVATNQQQAIVSVPIDEKLSVTGYAAVAATGQATTQPGSPVGHPVTVRRITPLLDALDCWGDPRGPVLSVVHNIDGFYDGSIWALLGVENTDLAASMPRFGDVLAQVITHMQIGLYLRLIRPKYACYRDGEAVTIAVEWKRKALDNSAIAITCSITDRSGKQVWSDRVDLATLTDAASPDLEFAVPPFKFQSDLYQVTVGLWLNGVEIDRMNAGFTAWKPDQLRAGRSVTFEHNYFHFDGRPTLLCGTKGGVFWIDEHLSEDPLTWDAECTALADHGLCVYGMVGLVQWIPVDLPAAERETKLRRLDALLQICHLHGIIPFIDLQFHPLPGVDREAEVQYARQLAERYHDVHTLLFYVTGDINMPLSDEPEMRLAWQHYLTNKYGTAAAVQSAWNVPVNRIEDEHVEPLNVYWQRKPWMDVKAADLNAFRTLYLRDWLARQSLALRRVSMEGAGKPGPESDDSVIAASPMTQDTDPHHKPNANTRLITAEFWSDQQLDQWNAATGLDFSAMGIGLGQKHYMHRYAAPMLCLADMRAIGQSFTIGEFGTQVHPAFDHVGYSYSDSAGKLDRFAMVIHYAFGLGGSMINTWDSADLDYYIFPWGLLHSDRRVSKPILAAYRNLNLFFRRMRPLYVPPSVLLVLPDENRRSGNFQRVTEALYNSARLLMQCRVDFNVINDSSLADLTTVPRVLFYPIPFCPDDAVVSELRRLAVAGSNVYLSGDISYDARRQRTRLSRLADLAGVRYLQEHVPPLGLGPTTILHRVTDDSRQGQSMRGTYTGHPCIDVEPVHAEPIWATEAGHGIAFRCKHGEGSVFYSTDPIELYSFYEDTDGNRARLAVYEECLAYAGVAAHPVNAPDHVYSFSLPLADGGIAFIFFNSDLNAGNPAQVRLTYRERTFLFKINAYRGGALVFDVRGQLLAWEGCGTLSVNGVPWITADADLLLFSADSNGIADCDALVILPLGPGSLVMHDAIRSRLNWQVQSGCIRHGAWQQREWMSTEQQAGQVTITWNDVETSSIIVAGHPESMPAAIDTVIAELKR